MKNCVCYYLYSEKDLECPVGISVFRETILNSNDQFVPRIMFYLLFDPDFFCLNIKSIQEWLISPDFMCAIVEICNSWAIDLNHVSLFLFELPETPEVLQLKSLLSIPWLIYSYYGNFVSNTEVGMDFDNSSIDTYNKVLNGSNNRIFHTSYQFIWVNPNFDIDYLPPNLEIKMKRSLKLYEQFQMNQNPFQSGSQSALQFQKVLEMREEYLYYSPFIKKKLKRYNRLRKLIWVPFLLHKHRKSYLNVFQHCLKQNFKLMQHFGFRLRCYQKDAQSYHEELSQYLPAVIINYLDAIPTEGSIYCRLVDDQGNLDPAFLTFNFTKDLLGDYIGICDMEVEPGKWLFLGNSCCSLRRDAPYSNQYYGQTMISQIFRGSGFGNIITLFAIECAALAGIFDIVIEDSTLRNIGTIKMTKFSGLISSGVIPNMIYSITGYQNSLPIVQGMVRKLFPSLEMIRYYAKNTDEDNNDVKDLDWDESLRFRECIENLVQEMMNIGDFSSIHYT